MRIWQGLPEERSFHRDYIFNQSKRTVAAAHFHGADERLALIAVIHWLHHEQRARVHAYQVSILLGAGF
jgi:hypothetical protein